MNDTLPRNTLGAGTDERRPVRAQTIVWGFILVAIAAVFFVWTQLDLNRYDPVVVVAWIVLVLGALAALAGILGGVLRRIRR